MKIRRKDDHFPPTALNESELERMNENIPSFWLIDDGGLFRYWMKDEWEIGPDEPELVDVTDSLHYGEAECWSNCKGVMQKQGLNIVLNEDYEWRKVDAYVIPPGAVLPYGKNYTDTYMQLQKYKQSVLTVWGSKL